MVGGGGGGGEGYFNRQNLLNVTKVICQWSLKNFVFRENRVGSEMAHMKRAFFATYDPTLTHILAP